MKTVGSEEEDQRLFVHRLPSARLVDRIAYLRGLAAGKRVIHIGFADARYRDLHDANDRWLHAHLAEVTTSLVGLDLDEQGVVEARERGMEAYSVDCCNPAAVAALGLEPADLVIAGEIIEHLDAPGLFLDALRPLCADDGTLVITTPNAAGWVNPLASLLSYEVNHPDHMVMFTWFTLTNLLRRHGWEPTGAATFLPSVKPTRGGLRLRIQSALARIVLACQRLLARVRPFTADGLIVSARPAHAPHEAARSPRQAPESAR